MVNEMSYTLITGASSGIGRAIAIKLSDERNLILHGRDQNRLEETRMLCKGKEHVLWCCDLKQIDSVGKSLITLLKEKQIKVECFIHCAGMVTVMAARMITLSATQEIFNVNFTSALEITATLLKKRINQKSLQNILFISSIWSQFGARGYSLYCSSKGALDAAMRALAVELAPVVRVNSLVLGAINTPMAENGFADAEINSNINKLYPLGAGIPENVAEMAAFIISDKANWITGQQLVVDGGRTANMSLK